MRAPLYSLNSISASMGQRKISPSNTPLNIGSTAAPWDWVPNDSLTDGLGFNADGTEWVHCAYYILIDIFSITCCCHRFTHSFILMACWTRLILSSSFGFIAKSISIWEGYVIHVLLSSRFSYREWIVLSTFLWSCALSLGPEWSSC